MDIQKKLEDYLNDNDSENYCPEDDLALMERMIDFIMDLEPDNLDEDQVDELTEIIDKIAEDELDDIDEAFSAKKVKINPAEKRERKRLYRKNKAKLKLKAKKFRRTSKYKKYEKRKKRMSARGKTSTGQRIRKFL